MQRKIFCLRQVDLYRGVSDNQFSQIAEEAVDMFFPAGDILYSTGEKNGHVYVIKEGEIELYKEENGKKIIVETLFPGDVFGDFGLGEYSHSAKIIRKSYLCKTPTHEFLDVIKAYPEITFRLMQVMAERTKQYEDKIAILSAPAKDQLYHTIKDLYAKNQSRFMQKVFSIPFKISHQRLAEKTGLNRVTVTKLMKQLQEEGKIVVDGDTKSIEVYS